MDGLYSGEYRHLFYFFLYLFDCVVDAVVSVFLRGRMSAAWLVAAGFEEGLGGLPSARPERSISPHKFLG